MTRFTGTPKGTGGTTAAPWVNDQVGGPDLDATALNRWETAILAAVNRGVITVAASTLPTAMKDAADFVCDGVDDQVQINQALVLATRAGDAFGGQSRPVVQLLGGEFSIADDNATSIKMYPNVWLRGLGWGTNLAPKWATNLDRGCIELLNTTVSHCKVSDLTIGRKNSVNSNGHGIKFVQSGSADAYEIVTGSDPFITIENLYINRMNGHGAWFSGATGGARESRIINCLFWNAAQDGLFIDGASDCQIIGCRSNSGGASYSGFHLGGGNTKIADCKAYFSDGDGFKIDSSRVEVSNCSAQDNGKYGFNFQSQDFTASGLVADSNGRTGSAAGGGFLIASQGVIHGLHAFDRGQTPANPQTRPIVISGSPQVYLTGFTRLGAGGTVHLTGSVGANSFVRLVRDGTTVQAVG